MDKVKGWSRTLELPYRIDYNSTGKGYNRSLGMGETAVIIIKETKEDSQFRHGEDKWTGTWKVEYRKYVYPTGQTYTLLERGFGNKDDALKYAVKFMKAHPKGIYDIKKAGKGWYGDTPGHRKAALKAERKGAINEPIKVGEPESEYVAQANTFLRKHGIKFQAHPKGDKCPLWCDGKHMHGNRYLIVFTKGKQRLSFSFWNSMVDVREGKRPTAYDVLASIQKYDVGSFDDFVSEFGYEKWEEDDYGRMKPNKKTMKTYKAVKAEWEKVNSFFTEDELEELREIN